MNESELRKFARAGALEMCNRAISEFPDILAELNERTRVLKAAKMDVTPLPRGVCRARTNDPIPAHLITRKNVWTRERRKAQSERLKKYYAAKKRSK